MIFRKPLLTLLFLIIAANSFASQPDSTAALVKYEEIKFTSPFEQKAFEGFFKKNEENYLALFSALSKEIDEKAFLNNQSTYLQKLEKVKAQTAKAQKEDKQIKAIYKNAHESFLKKYELINEFSHIFKNGQYNCVSASALYGMIFRDLGIPFTIKEKPTHVYIISFPDTHRILVETTDPNGGFYVFDNKYKANYVNKLKQHKIISSEEYGKHSTDYLFDKYHFSDEDVDLRKLVGIQYMNHALSMLDDNKPEEAYAQLEKAYLFYPCEKAIFLMQFSLSMILSTQEINTPKNIKYLARLSRFENAAQSTDLYAYFHNLTQDYLINNYRPTLFKDIFTQLVDEIEDEEIKNEISYIYFFETGRVSFNKGKYKESTEAAKQAFLLKPENTDAQTIFVSAISKSLNRIGDNTERIKTLENLSAEFPVLLENSLFTSNLSQVYLIQFLQHFEMGNAKEGEKYKKMFEKVYKEMEDSMIDSSLIGRAYSMAAVYYFKKGDNAKTRQILKQGLELAPNNYELTQRLHLAR